MTKFESSIKEIPYSSELVYSKLSDLNNLEAIKDKIPEEKAKDLTFDTDNVSVSVHPIGKIALQIIEREPTKCIKFETTSSPAPFNLWIQLVPTSETSCKVKLTLGAQLNPFIKGMVQKPLQEGLEKIVELLSKLPY